MPADKLLHLMLYMRGTLCQFRAYQMCNVLYMCDLWFYKGEGVRYDVPCVARKARGQSEKGILIYHQQSLRKLGTIYRKPFDNPEKNLTKPRNKQLTTRSHYK